jgi:hypothetical protein
MLVCADTDLEVVDAVQALLAVSYNLGLDRETKFLALALFVDRYAFPGPKYSSLPMRSHSTYALKQLVASLNVQGMSLCKYRAIPEIKRTAKKNVRKVPNLGAIACASILVAARLRHGTNVPVSIEAIVLGAEMVSL